MTKYCIMRECENIHSWAFSHQQGIYSFKFPKRFLEISSRDLNLFSILAPKDLIANSLMPFPFAFTRLSKQQSDILTGSESGHHFTRINEE